MLSRHPRLPLLSLGLAGVGPMEALELGGVGQLGAGLYQETDPEGLQPSASHPGSPEAHHDAGGGHAAGHAGMAAHEHRSEDGLL